MQKAISVSLILALAINLLFFPVTTRKEERLDPDCTETKLSNYQAGGDRYYMARCDRGFITKRIPAWGKTSYLYKKDFTLFFLQVIGTGVLFSGVAYMIYRKPVAVEKKSKVSDS